MNEIYYNIALAILTLIGAIITRYIVPFLQKKAQEAEMELRATEHALAADIVHEAVYAVEQLMKGDASYNKNFKSKELIHTAFRKYGISISNDQIDRMIEAVIGQSNEGRDD